MMDEYMQHLIGMAGMVVAALVAWFVAACLEKWIVTPLAKRLQRYRR